jgi:hypothetical protein
MAEIYTERSVSALHDKEKIYAITYIRVLVEMLGLNWIKNIL